MKSSEALAELDFKITEVNLSGVARGDPPQTPINFTSMDLTEVAQGGLELELHEEEEEENNYIEVKLTSILVPPPPLCNSSAMLTSWEASPTRR